ncbi:MAG: hypothetical protein WCB27_14025 [Thermoguttaceae bacterium]
MCHGVLNHCERERTRQKHFRPAVIEMLAEARLKHDDLLDAQSRWLRECLTMCLKERDNRNVRLVPGPLLSRHAGET